MTGLDLDRLVLDEGAHDPGTGACVMEAAAYVAGEPWSDSPDCVSPVIARFLRSWNDAIDDEARQELVRYLECMVCGAIHTAGDHEPVVPLLTTGGDGHDEARAWMAADWLVRDYVPRWLRLAGLAAQADALAGLPELRPGVDMDAIRPTIDAARRDADVVRSAAGVAAWVAAQVAARPVVWDVAGSAAWIAARVAAGGAARDRLAPTVAACQASAHRLVERMIEAGR